MVDNNSPDWRIDHQCPQCGAPASLSEHDRLLSCPYCRTKLYLTTDDHFRYCIPAPQAASREIIYLPYWRLKGLSFSVTGQEVTHRFFDATVAALAVPGLPFSLGLRPQALTVRFASPEMPGRFLAPRISARQAMERLSPAAPSAYHQAFIGDIASLVYSPAYRENDTLVDALLQRPLCRLRPETWEGLLASGPGQGGRLHFLSTLCPQCGWDLEGERDALVLICRNCDTAWRMGAGAEKIPFSVMTDRTADRSYLHLPFWRMRAHIEGITLHSYADLIRIGNLPKAIVPAFEEKPLYFWSPAFKVNPALFLRWARQMTLYQPAEACAGSFPEAALHPVTLPLTEAQEGIIVTLAGLINDKRRLFPLLSRLRVTLEESLLEYHPFFPAGNELVHAVLRLAIDKNALAFGMQI